MGVLEGFLITFGCGWKFKLTIRPSLFPTQLEKVRVFAYCSLYGLYCHHGREWCWGGFSTSRQWWNSWLSTRPLLIPIQQKRIEYFVTTDDSESPGCPHVLHQHYANVCGRDMSLLSGDENLGPLPSLFDISSMGSWASCYNQAGVKVYSPQLSYFWGDGDRISFCFFSYGVITQLLTISFLYSSVTPFLVH